MMGRRRTLNRWKWRKRRSSGTVYTENNPTPVIRTAATFILSRLSLLSFFIPLPLQFISFLQSLGLVKVIRPLNLLSSKNLLVCRWSHRESIRYTVSAVSDGLSYRSTTH
jgi:hypothetical protein